ncbi:bifunctional RNase H/acid phosphatase [Streptomyces collinus]|uniref:bifunctional RNase H/acid phosphatase n=1 Tax=Streptomyces collinus TaxID=42684 RepID=UPI00332F8193
MREFIVEADGGSRGNPGPAGYGALVADAATGETLAEAAEYIGVATNNVAEYRGLLAGLRAAHALDPGARVHVRMDSKLVVEQMSGRWKIKHPDMKPLAAEARGVFAPGQVTYEWIPRERNKHADRLANEAMDAGAKGGQWSPSASRAALDTPPEPAGPPGDATAGAARARAALTKSRPTGSTRTPAAGVSGDAGAGSVVAGGEGRAEAGDDAVRRTAQGGDEHPAVARSGGRSEAAGGEEHPTAVRSGGRSALAGGEGPIAAGGGDDRPAVARSKTRSAAPGSEARSADAGGETRSAAPGGEASAAGAPSGGSPAAARSAEHPAVTGREPGSAGRGEERAAAGERKHPSTPGWSAAPDMGAPATFVLLRHGETPLTPQKRFSGSGGTDPSLSDAGREQARRVAEALARRGTVQAIVASPLARTRETAGIVAARLGLDVAIDDGLRETDFGAWEGLTFGEVRDRYPDDLNAWLADPAARPTGGGESFTETAVRIEATREKLVAAYAGRTVLLVTHVTPIKTFVRLALGAPDQALFRMELSAASLSAVAYYADGNASVRLFNDTSHLRP